MNALVTDAPAVRARKYLGTDGMCHTEYSSPAFLAGRVVEFHAEAMALHMSGVELHRGMTTAEVARAVVTALVEFGPLEIERRDAVARRANLTGTRRPWSVARMTLCTDLAYRLTRVLWPAFVELADQAGAVFVDLTGDVTGTAGTAVAA
ncbi:hypothetical protein [Saccharothrix deserti]|uniref:hypothetical protein n=1 Tax=Saccharothrix deserti TaxID=2593674 RepID=UPI00131BA84A|nr:hypothetical protein [Saccharothrix deserti]